MEVENYASSSASDNNNNNNNNNSYSDDEVINLNDIHDDEQLLYSSSTLFPKLQIRKVVSLAYWNDALEMAEIIDNKGRLWTTTGIIRDGRIYCSIEETLFLAEIGALHLLRHNVHLPLEEIYKMVAQGKGGCSWECFEVYRHIKSLGYIVGRHGIPWTMRRVTNNPLLVEATEQICESIDQEHEDKSLIVELVKSMHIAGAKPMFDVYHPNTKFKKSCPGNPSFVLCLTSGYPPSKAEVKNLERQCGCIPLKFCQVEHGRVSFFSFNAVELPQLP